MDSVIPAVNVTASPIGARSSRLAPLLVGRTLEQTLLREELAAVVGGRGRLVLLDGEAGIGKTALARDLASEATARGVNVLAGGCYDLTNTPPYGPWLDLFEACARDHDALSPPTAFANGRMEQVTDQAALFADVREFFVGLVATRPALLLLEDLHWADPASLELLRHLAPRLRHWSILLLVTYRGDELTRRHPFAQQLPALVREADGLRLDVGRLDEAALDLLVGSRYRLPVTDRARLVTYLDRHAEGNPFFTNELLQALQEKALLRPAGDGWTLDEIKHVVVPSLLRHMIEARVSRLGEATRRPLAMASVIGPEVPFSLWARLAEIADEDLWTIVERGVDANVLEVDPDGTHVRFVHAITRESLYASVLPPRRRLWHLRVGEALVESAHPNPDVVAYHFQAAGDPRAIEWLIAAGERAQRAYAWLTAAERLKTASFLLANVEGEEQTRGRLECRVAYLKRFSDPIGAIEAIDQAARLAERIGDAGMIAETQWVRGLLLCYADRFRTGLAEMVAGIAALETPSPALTRVPTTIRTWLTDALPNASSGIASEDDHNDNGERQVVAEGVMDWRGASLGRFLASAGHIRATVEDCERSVSMLAETQDARSGLRAAIAFALHGLGIAYAGLGRPAEARSAFHRARVIFAELGHHALVAFTLLDEMRDVAMPYRSVNPGDRHGLADEAEAALGRTGGALRPGVSSNLAWLGCLVLDGRWQEADQIIRDLPATGNSFFRREIVTARAALAHHRGAPDQVWADIRSLLPDGPGTEPGDLILQEGLFLQRLAVDLCLEADDLPAARSWLEANNRWLAWSECVLGCADGQLAWARYHRAAGALARSRDVASDALVLATMPDQPFVRLEGHRLLGEIETEAANYDVAETHLMTSLDLAKACESPFDQALTLLSLAHMRLVTGRSDDAADLLAKVRDICEPLNALPTLARVDALAARLTSTPGPARDPAGLTQREVEVLQLLPLGHTNAQIAEALFISPRTVQTHLSNLYAKLGVGGRAEAVAYAVSNGFG